MFPGSQPAGMVKQRPGDAARQVTPVYFFRLPLPEGFADAAGLAPAPGGQANQAACQVDPLGRFLYVVYIPEMERAGETIVLRRSNRRRRNGWGGSGLDRETSRPGGGNLARAAGGDVCLRAERVRSGSRGAGRQHLATHLHGQLPRPEGRGQGRVSFPLDTQHVRCSATRSSIRTSTSSKYTRRAAKSASCW